MSLSPDIRKRTIMMGGGDDWLITKLRNYQNPWQKFF